MASTTTTGTAAHGIATATRPAAVLSPMRARAVAEHADARVAVRSRLRLTRRGRLVFGALAVIALTGAGIGITQAATATASDDTATVSTTQFATITVLPGETLWSLAERVAPDHDPRDVIADIVRLNNLPSSAVSAGQRIALPTYASAA